MRCCEYDNPACWKTTSWSESYTTQHSTRHSPPLLRKETLMHNFQREVDVEVDTWEVAAEEVARQEHRST